MNRHKWFLFSLCCFLLCGCAQSEVPTDEEIRLKVAIFNGAYHTSYWEESAKAFEAKHPGVKVDLNISADIGNILMPRMSVGDVPDVVYLGSTNDSDYTQKMIEEERIASLEDVFSQELQAQFLSGLLDSKLVRPYADQKLYLAPLYYNVTGLWYNKRLFEQYGYEVPSTWEEFFALGEQAKANGQYLFTYQGLSPTYLEAMLWPMLAEKIGLEQLHAIFENQAGAWGVDGVEEVLQNFAQIAQNGYMKEDTILLTYTQAQKRFLDGEALFLPCGNWLLQEMSVEETEAQAYGFMSVPSFTKGAQRYATVMVEQIYVPKDAAHQDLAKEFLVDQFQSEAVMKNQQSSGGLVPIQQDFSALPQENPFYIFTQDIHPITTDFDLGKDRDLEKDIFEQLSLILANKITPKEMIAHMNHR